MSRPRAPRPLLAWAAAALGLAAAAPAGAQVYVQDAPTFTVSGQLTLAFEGDYQPGAGVASRTQTLLEGAQLTIGGWLFDSRWARFTATVLGTRLDALGAGPASYSFGYGGTLALFPSSIVPVSLGVEEGLSVAGSSVEPAATIGTTTYSAAARLDDAGLPHAEVEAQRMISEGQDGERATNDALVASVYGTAPLQRYAAIFDWNADQYGGQGRTTRSAATLTDDVYPTTDTQGHLEATLTQGSGFGGAADAAFTGYQASTYLLSRLSSAAVLRAGYSFSDLTSPGGQELSHLASLGSTIQLGHGGLILGEAVSAGSVQLDEGALHQSVQSVSGSQGLASSVQLGPVAAGGFVTGQAGYTGVAGGRSGALLGYSLSGSARLPLPQAPVSASAEYTERDDRSSAGLSARSLEAVLTSTVTRVWPLTLIPYVTYLHVSQADPSLPGGWLDSSAFAASTSGSLPVARTLAAFAAGYSDTWSGSGGGQSSLLFGRASDAFRLGQRTFGNVAIDLAHYVGAATTASLLASAVWTFRESQLALSYTYNQAWPGGAPEHAIALVFSRGFQSSFLPESR